MGKKHGLKLHEDVNIQSYPTIFSDKIGEIETTIFNDFEYLSICLEGIWFIGREFSTLEVQNLDTLSAEQIARFDLAHYQDLHDCTFRLSIPQLLIDTTKKTQTLINWQIIYELGKLTANGGLDKDYLTIMIELPNHSPIIGQGQLFEEAINQILSQLNPDFKTQNSPRPVYFKNCYGCQWSDYLIFGNSSFGDLVCYVDYQADYARILDRNSGIDIKDGLMELMEKDAHNRKWVQEIYCCEQFTPRPIGSGYRG